MVDGIQGNGRVNSNIKLNNIEKLKNSIAAPLGVFGFGKAKETSYSGPVEALAAKFNFEAPKYPKGGIKENLVIKAEDYIQDDVFKENAYCEV